MGPRTAGLALETSCFLAFALSHVLDVPFQANLGQGWAAHGVQMLLAFISLTTPSSGVSAIFWLVGSHVLFLYFRGRRVFRPRKK